MRKVLIGGKVIILRSGGFRILAIDSSIRIGLFVYNFRKKILTKKMFLVFLMDFLFPNWKKTILIFKLFNKKDKVA